MDNMENKIKYSLDCKYFNYEFDTIEDLVDYIMINGVDPNYEITKNNKGIGEKAIELIYYNL